MRLPSSNQTAPPRARRLRARAAAPEPTTSTRDRILDAAEGLFASHTFSGTQVDRVARVAGVNKRLIYHYFGDKAGLYGEVLRRVHRRWTTFDYFREAPKDPVEFIDGFVCWSFQKYRDDPNFVKLIVGENILEGRYFEIASPSPFTLLLLTTVSEVVQRGKIQGVIRPDLDPVQLLGTIIGLCFFTFSNAYTMSRTLQVDLRDPGVLAERLAHIRDVVRRSVAPGG
jgi:TetR/AcrR family transcriptional regulator